LEPWRARLAESDTEAAWNLFIDRYRRLVLAVIRRTVHDGDIVMDAFAHVCARLAADDLARLRRHEQRPEPRARFSTWLVAVVHNLAIDFVRQRDGRRRLKPPAGLSGIQRRIFSRVFVEQRSHAEAYELVRAGASGDLTFGSYLRELADTYRVIESQRPGGVMRYLGGPPAPAEPAAPSGEAVSGLEERRRRLQDALQRLSPDVRLAVQLFVIEELPAADVARALRWPNAKAVYNRVYRALGTLRTALERDGLGPADL
jgi:RNA polymerase sigma factor (sigma-70 family)